MRNPIKETTSSFFYPQLQDEIEKCINNRGVLRVKSPTGKNFVVIGESEWDAISETLYLNQFPGLVESIHEAAKEPIEYGTPLSACLCCR